MVWTLKSSLVDRDGTGGTHNYSHYWHVNHLSGSVLTFPRAKMPEDSIKQQKPPFPQLPDLDCSFH